MLDPDEALVLRALAENLGLTLEQERRAQLEWVGQLKALASADGTVTEREREDLRVVADALGINLEQVGAVRPAAVEKLRPGTTVCFTGALQCSHGGQLLTRERARALALAAGLDVVKNVSGRCDVLVLADPLSQSGKARRARDLGVRLIAEPAFWPMIGVAVT